MTLTGKAKLAGVMGWPVGHSRSPQLHGHWLARYGIDGAYVPLPVRPENLAEALAALPKLGFAGVNLTVPHKEAALTMMAEIEPLARRIGAVNTVIVRPDGTLLGRNTDAYGVRMCLDEGAPQWRRGSGPAVVLGAGGAARAVVAALLDTSGKDAGGVSELRLVNRSRTRAEALAAAFGGNIRVYGFDEVAPALAGATLLVNATTLGMTGQPPLALALAPLDQAASVLDLVYAPLETELLRAARARGLTAVDGLGMLLHQARPGFAAWFGVDPEVTPELRAAVLATR